MPYYEYRCKECGRVFEIRASFAEKSAGLDPECPVCHAKEAQQVVTAGLMLRGAAGDASSSCCGPNAGPGCCG